MKKGFTLAEVLLALAIIGIIAAITLPAMRTRVFERRTVAWHAKYCHILDAAVGQLWVDGSLTTGATGNYIAQITATNLAPYLQVSNLTFKDGAVLSTPETANGTITVTFPTDSHVPAATYTVDPAYEGINCESYMSTINNTINTAQTPPTT